MRTAVLRKLVWASNALIGVAVVMVAAGPLLGPHGPGPDAGDVLLTNPGTRPAPPPPESRRRSLSVDDLDKVFSRTFSPAGSAASASSSQGSGTRVPDAPESEPAPAAAKPEPPAAPPLQSLLRLVAVLHHSDPFLSGVVIENIRNNNQQELYWYSDRIRGIDAKIVQVEENCAHFLYAGQEVVIALSGAAGAARPVPVRTPSQAAVPSPAPAAATEPVDPQNHRVVPRQEVLDVLAKPIEALRGMRYTLVENNGQVVGFKIAGIDPQTVAGRYGFKENDVISEINGKRVDTNFNPFTMVSELLNTPVIRVRVKRENQELLLSYEFK
ncbi:MAG: hypothetical protein HYU36_12905 [Planctomycetes bacterium]|nr:hypothetical protein [Planctomycetota bacterium]